MNYVWTCRCCGKQHDTLPLSFSPDAPAQWYGLPAAEREIRAELDTDVCIIDRESFFVRGCVEIPIVDFTETLMLGLWVSLSKTSFARVVELWNAAEVDNEPPLFGWLSNSVEIYPDCLGLKTNVFLRSGDLRPKIELQQPNEHALAVDQRNGITLERVQELVAVLLGEH